MQTQGPIRRIGILGAGQLALMLAEAAAPLGLRIVCAGALEDCAATVAPVEPVDLADARDVARFAAGVDAVTIESENISADVLDGLRLFPNLTAIATSQDRLLEKQFLARCGVRTAPWAAVDSLPQLYAALAQLGTPAILKTRRMGYDGKGQVRLKDADRAEADAAWAAVGEVPCVLEGHVHFIAEVSLIGARGHDGTTVFYPLTENVHRAGILRRSEVPSRFAHLQSTAERLVRDVMLALEYVGVLAVEFFVAGDTLIANEMAPRVHNSGHWTIEGADVSQFAMHLRAIAGSPLHTPVWSPTVMLNAIGSMPTAADLAAYPAVHRHDYRKAPRPGRKLGHLTVASRHGEALAHWEKERLAADIDV